MVDVGVIFGMIIAVMVITLVFVFGYQQLTNMQDVQNSAEMIRAADNIGVAIERVYDEGGESSARHRLSFPPTVRTVCFVPIFNRNYNPKIPYSASDLEWQLESQGLAEGSNAEVIAQRRETAMQAPKDPQLYNVLVFFTASDSPKWYVFDHLDPSIKYDGSDEHIFCTGPRETVWLQRRFDSDGAWVDVERE